MRTYFYLLLFITIIFFTCEKNITQPNHDQKENLQSEIFLKLDMSSAPAEVVNIKGELTRAGYDTIDFTLIIQSDSAFAKITNIPAGKWTLKVDAYNSDNLVIYSGSTEVYVNPGVTTPVHLHLNPTTGEILVTVTWGDRGNLKYQMVLYGKDLNSYSDKIYTLDINGNNLIQITRERSAYPIWYDHKRRIMYLDLNNYNIILKDTKHPFTEDTVVTRYNENIMFIRYSNYYNCLLFSYYIGGISRIGKMDMTTSTIEKISQQPYDERNPVPSEVDDWIYFSTNFEGTSDIYRMKYDGSDYQSVISDPQYNYTTFSLSVDGKLIVSSKYNDTNSYLIIYNITTKEEQTVFDFSAYGTALYPSFTIDNKYILFVIGTPYDYSIPRNIYRINYDGTDLMQLTFFNVMIFGRPLSW